ncbi:MAG: Phospho-N-acetylmuramoyl-pentapeptide-transferase [Phycisphaerae bacterium]|nr:Phospho-N-acetylmuramoyl-pentapeptide-transferase [Phycisphaerae bacterium]
MLYHFFVWLTGDRPYAYASPLFRGTLAVIFAFLIVWWLGPRAIATLRRLKIGDRPEFDHAQLNAMTAQKADTPTMGGVLIVIAVLATILLLANLLNFYVRMAMFCIVWLACIGGADDWLKLTKSRRVGTRTGLRTWEKLVFQIALGALLAVFALREGRAKALEDRWTDPGKPYNPAYRVLSVPFYKGEKIGDYHGVLLPTAAFAVLAVVVIVGTSNAVNLTDGMDGLASGCMVLTAFGFMVLAAVVGSADLAKQLLVFHIPGTAELSVICGATVGACLGFLWYNCYPAQVFMGDTGSLPLGGLMGYVAIVTRLESMLVLVGGIFVIEALSVILQVGYFKLTGGKRLFRVAPIHHHFHLGGWTETQVVMRFWLLSAIFAAFALATLKLR